MEKSNIRETVFLDKERTLAYPIFALIRLKREQGVELKDLQDDDKSQDLEVILSVIWAGLIHEDKDLTVEQVGYMVDLSDIPDISEKMGRIFSGMSKGKNSGQ